MKILFTNTALVLLSIGTLLSSCSKPERSQKTGIPYNNKSYGYQKFRQTHPSPGPGLVAIEGGTFVLGGSADQDVNFEYNNVRKRVTIPAFYMDETEVSNQDWLDYLHWISATFPADHELYYNALPDTLVWRRPLSHNDPYVDNYLRHPAFQDYPVVGVTWNQAQDYCQWRTDRTNEFILQQQNIIVNPRAQKTAKNATAANAQKTPFNTDMYLNNQFRGPGIDGKGMKADLNGKPAAGSKKAVRPAIIEDGILKPAYRLPTEAEWEYAALSYAGNTQFENINDGKIYPWNGLGVRSAKKATRGLILANFKRGAGDNAGVGGYLNDKAIITAPVRSYVPNDFGLYQMAGNVNEWVQDTYRQMSFEDVDDFNPFRGNQFTDKRLSNPSTGMYAKDKYGHPIKDPAKAQKKMTYAELIASQNAQNAAPTAKDPLAGKPYNADQRGALDTVNTSLYGTTTLVSDHSKVYKGGSWNDMAYWLNPATRRFMNEDDASAEVGFRCAMDLVGAPEIHPSGKPHFAVKKVK
ncbi:SUMF1/EgtB/PvdO family nonheme iron enzyme [Mucilaginibacter sp.]|uniref:SUMF1/EgtB/PvdO family nonheme iron enzyme n=1 Tax=Mucilaginibacter sp. TaxID=1882438 RepID=UPI0026226E72|nr:SUMF1/EgtB/PvdO family nonheme iron enzyme [Mucilaginibacter sp.]MDB4924302.1 gliding motility lipoprotein GldJ [Mucilaginibacter sp.]